MNSYTFSHLLLIVLHHHTFRVLGRTLAAMEGMAIMDMEVIDHHMDTVCPCLYNSYYECI